MKPGGDFVLAGLFFFFRWTDDATLIVSDADVDSELESSSLASAATVSASASSSTDFRFGDGDLAANRFFVAAR